MRHIIFILILVSNSFALFSQNVFWATNAVGSGMDQGEGIALNNNGDIYVAGSFEGAALAFGTQTINNTSPGTSDIFVAKFDANGNCAWAKSVGGTHEDFGTALSVDKNSGDVYVAGYFKSSSISFTGQPITNNGWGDIILLKFNSSGTAQWGIGIGGTSDEEAAGISIDPNGNIYLTGYYYSNSVNFGNSTVINNGWVDLFIAKFNSSGNNLWAKGIGGNDDESAYSIVSDANGNAFITGYFHSPSVAFGANTLTNSSGNDYLFVAKYDASGTAVWAKAAASANGDVQGNGIAVDNSGNAYICGYFAGNTLTLSNTLINANPGHHNVFAAKYNSSGVEQWSVNPTSGPESNNAYCITADNSGNISISGWYTSPSINFNGIPLNSIAAGDNIFLARYNTNGIIQNAYSFCGTANSGGYGNSICSDVNGNVFLTGYFEGINMTFGLTTLTNTGSYDVYWTKIGFGASGIENMGNPGSLTIYPNPVSDFAVFQWANASSLSEWEIEITDITGKIFRCISTIGNTMIINRENMDPGMYFCRMKNHEGAFLAKKIIFD